MIQQGIKKAMMYENLSENEMIEIIKEIMNKKATSTQVASFLTALHMKKESIEEILGATKVMRSYAHKIEGIENAIDTCGTGGDGQDTFNISTVSAFVASAADVKIIKHGNRSVSSKCGSADVLEALGAKIDLEKEQVKRCIDHVGIGFLFAPMYHPAMKNVMKVRKELGMKTLFNILGPLMNPAKVTGQVLGVFDERLTYTLACVLKEIGVKRAMVVHGYDGMDEISIVKKTKVCELKDGKIHEYHLDPRDYGIPFSTQKDIVGGNVLDNAKVFMDILKGEKGPKRDIVLLNAGAAIYISGKVDSLKEGIHKAKKVIDSGLALEKWHTFLKFTKETTHDLR